MVSPFHCVIEFTYHALGGAFASACVTVRNRPPSRTQRPSLPPSQTLPSLLIIGFTSKSRSMFFCCGVYTVHTSVQGSTRAAPCIVPTQILPDVSSASPAILLFGKPSALSASCCIRSRLVPSNRKSPVSVPIHKNPRLSLRIHFTRFTPALTSTSGCSNEVGICGDAAAAQP